MGGVDDRVAAMTALRIRIAGLVAPACAMAHERIRFDPTGRPLPATVPNAEFSRPDICPAAIRARHLGCNHTTARYALADALGTLGSECDPMMDRLRALDGCFGTLDQRRYAAESRRAVATLAADADGRSAAEATIADLEAEHRALAADILAIRDAVLARLDGALDAARQVTCMTLESGRTAFRAREPARGSYTPQGVR